jgi:hypothetical protein
LREIRGFFGHRLIGGAAGDRDKPRAGRMVHRPVQGTPVELDHHDRVAISEQSLYDRPTDTPTAPGNHIGTAHDLTVSSPAPAANSGVLLADSHTGQSANAHRQIRALPPRLT